MNKEDFIKMMSERISRLKSEIKYIENTEKKLEMELELTKIMLEFGKLMFTE